MNTETRGATLAPTLAKALPVLLAAVLLVACGGGGGFEGGEQPAPTTSQQPDVTPPAPAPAPTPPPDPAPVFMSASVRDTLAYDIGPEGSLKKTEALEQAARSQHAMTLNGQAVNYVATAGHLNIPDAAMPGESAARMFYAAYTLPDGGSARPITFFYNGGPGSSSVWLHLGSFAPKRAQVNAPNYYSAEANGNGEAPRFDMVDNQETLLATTDMVFVDAIGTGYSQAIEPKKNIDFWNTDADAAAFRDFIIRYLSENKRAGSPIYLAGESYGGPRTAILGRLLAEQGYMANGLLLISPILNYNSNCSKDKSTSGSLYISCIGFVPTYAAMQAHHFPKFLPAGKTVTEYIDGDVTPYVEGTYDPALKKYMAARQKFNNTPTSDTEAKAAAKAELDAQGLVMDEIAKTMREKYGVEIIRAKGMPYNPKPIRLYETGGTLPNFELGRYDSRIAVPSDSVWAKEGDPASTLLRTSYSENIKTLLESMFDFIAASIYALKTNDAWTFEHSINGAPATDKPVINGVDTIPDIQATLKLNPKMKIMAISGFHDMATPPHLTKLDLDRLTGSERNNLRIKNYEGGHMMYLTDSSRVLLKADLEAFYKTVPIQ